MSCCYLTSVFLLIHHFICGFRSTREDLHVVFFVLILPGDCRTPESVAWCPLCMCVCGLFCKYLWYGHILSLLFWDSNYVNIRLFHHISCISYAVFCLYHAVCYLFQPGDFLWVYLPVCILLLAVFVCC